jgi:hypothetical protein
MILLRILEHDLHRPRVGMTAFPCMIEVPALPSFVPAVVSNSRGSFIVSRRLTNDGRIRVGIFDYDSNKLDQVIGELFGVAFSLSLKEKFGNLFFSNSAESALSYVGKNSGMPGVQPHVCMIPSSWNEHDTEKFFGPKHFDGKKYKGYCNVITSNVSCPVFLSRPDMVGMYTQFLGGGSGILLHNIKFGISFCPNDKPIS